MGLIYANARCVISATASKDTEGSCYLPRDLYRSALMICEKGDNRYLAVHREAQLSELFKEKVNRSQRGWTFREQCLSSRTLHFTSGCVLFEYNEFIASDHDTWQVRQQYESRHLIRNDGKLHPKGNSNFAIKKEIAKTEFKNVKTMYCSYQGKPTRNSKIIIDNRASSII